MSDTPSIMLGGVAGTDPEVTRMCMCVWGPAGTGKTTLAATMPGRKAFISFDPDGTASIMGYDNVTVFDLSGTADSYVARFKDNDPLGIERTLEHFDSYIIDSGTTVVERCLGRGISETKGATLERPSPGAYGARKNLFVNFIRNIINITGKHDKHLLITAHETVIEQDDVSKITMSLGGSLPNDVALRINEVWNMFENSSGKQIMVRASRGRAPVKTRMFDVVNIKEFTWRFNPNEPEAPDNIRIDRLFEQWKAGGFKKLALPK